MAAPLACSFFVPGDWHTPTGGYRYDSRIVRELQRCGWLVEQRSLHAGFPWPPPQALVDAARQFAALPDGMLAVVDGLAFGALARIVAPHADRLRLVALVHHPLHLETGLDAASSAQLRAQEQRALAAARHVIVTSAATAHDVMRLGVAEARISVVEPGTDLPSRAETPPRPAVEGAAGGPLRLLCVAALVPRKGHALLLEALAGLVHLPWTLDCVGSAQRDPATAHALHARSAEPDLAGRVRWQGELDDRALAAHYAAADLFVLASLHEGYGMAVAEALAAGLPVVASSGCALAQTLPPDAAQRFAAGDSSALRAVLARLIADPAERARRRRGALAAAQALPTWQRAGRQFHDVLARVVAASA